MPLLYHHGRPAVPWSAKEPATAAWNAAPPQDAARGLKVNRAELTIETLQTESQTFAEIESSFPEPSLYGRSDGKKVGTYLEHKFRAYLAAKYSFAQGNSASGIDFPGLGVDMKVTSVAQPQSSCPYSSAGQKIFGLGYSLLVFVYEKTDDPKTETSTLNIKHVVLIPKELTADFQMTRGIQEILDKEGNEEDLASFILDRGLLADAVQVNAFVDRIMKEKSIALGYLTISNALQWRLQYGHAIAYAGRVEGLEKLR